MADCIDHGQKGNNQGYGHYGKIRAHRKVFKDTFGYLPVVVMHICDNPRCINPEHLTAGDWDKNNKDRATKGRSAKTRYDLRKLSFEQAQVIRSRYEPSNGSTKKNKNGVSALAREFKVDANVIYQIVKNKTHAC